MAGEPIQIGRYILHDEIASGGMAKVHLGRAVGALGFSRIVAIKRILPHLLAEQEFVEMFVDETRLAARIQHPNVISTLDAVATEGEVFLVMEHVLGESTARLLRVARKHDELVHPNIAVAIIGNVLRGLHAAHETRGDMGELLGVVHRDVSPQNVLVGVDGVTRIIDFGVAKARGRLSTTRDGKIKGKLAYMSPEQLRGGEPDRRADIYASGVILWEALAGRRLHQGDNDAIVYANVLHNPVYPPSRFAPHISRALDDVVMRAIARDLDQRFATAEEMALALEHVMHGAGPSAVGDWVRRLGGEVLAARTARIAEIERGVYVATSARSLVANESGSHPTSPTTDHHSDGSGSRPASSSRAHVADGRAHRDIRATDESAAGYGRSMPYDVAPKRPRLLLPIIAGTLFASLIASVLVVVFTNRSTTAPPHAGSLSVATTTATASVSASTTTDAPSPSSPSTEPSASVAVASASVSASAAKITFKPAVLPPRQPKSSCDPPWYLDAKNIKRFKPECM